MISLNNVADLRVDYPNCFSTYGSKVRAFANAEVHRDLLRVVNSSGRDCTSVARWLIDEATSGCLMDGLDQGASVIGHKPGGPSVVMRIPPKALHIYKEKARNQRCYQNSVSHFLGLALELGLRTKPLPEWVQFFTQAEDLVELIWRSFEAYIPHLSPSLDVHHMTVTHPTRT